jgi:beta-lactamase regulating signal transducer with metallopeptidase domain/biotin carboxyl carrier protein
MNTIHVLLAHPFVSRFGWSLAHFVWEGAALVAVLALALWLLRRSSANARYLVSSAFMLLMAAAVPVTFLALPESPQTVVVTPSGSPPPPSALIEVMESASFDRSPTGEAASEEAADAATANKDVPPLPTETESTPTGPWYTQLLGNIDRTMPWAVFAWLIGVTMLSIRLAAGWVIVQRMRRRFVEPVTEQLRLKVENLARRVGIVRTVHAFQSRLAEVPSAVGWLKPVILLPVGAITGLSTQQLEAIIAHELAHIRRHDYLVNLLQSVVETLLFYHPAVWWVSHRVRVEREHCCDDLAVAVCGNPVDYARALSTMESFRGTPQLLAAATGGSLLLRIRRILGVAAPAGNQFSRYAAGLLVILTMVTFIAVVELSSATANAADRPPTTQPATAPANEPENMRAQPHRWRHFERIVVSNDAITFEGLLTDWDHVGEQMEKTPHGMAGEMGGYGGGLHTSNADAAELLHRLRKTTVLELAKASDDVPDEVFDQASEHAHALVARHGYEYLSHIGVHPLGSSGSPSQFLPPITRQGRWRHFVRCTPVRGASPAQVDGESAGMKDPRSGLAGLPAPQWTMLELTVAPGIMTPTEYEAAKSNARKLVQQFGLEGMVDLGIRPTDEKASPSIFVPDDKQPGEWGHCVTLVVGKDRQTYQGDPIEWSQLEAKIAALPDRPHTCFCMAIESQELEARWHDLRRAHVDPVLGKLGINHFSFIGVHPLGTKGGPSIFTPTAPARATTKLPAPPTSDKVAVALPPPVASRPADTDAAVTRGSRSSRSPTTIAACSPAEGMVKEIVAKPGQTVHKGDLLARLDDEEIKIELDDAKARLESARQQAALEKRRYEQGLGDQIPYLKAEEAAKLAEIDIRRWTLRLERTQIKSPCDGVISQLSPPERMPGQRVNVGDTVAIVEPSAQPTASQPSPESSSGIKARLGLTVTPFPSGDNRCLYLTFPGSLFEDALNDKLISALIPNPPGSSPTRAVLSSVILQPGSGVALQGDVRTGAGARYSGRILYLRNKDWFFFWGRSTIENRADVSDDHLYGPFPATVLHEMPSLSTVLDSKGNRLAVANPFGGPAAPPADPDAVFRDPLDDLIDQAQSPEEAQGLRLLRNYQIAREQFGEDHQVTRRMKSDLQAYEQKMAANQQIREPTASRPASESK